MKIPDRALPLGSLLLLVVTCRDDDDDGDMGEVAAIVGEWSLASIYDLDTQETYAYPMMFDDPDSGCTHLTSEHLDFESNLEGIVRIIVDNSGCDNSAYDGTHVTLMEHIVAEESGPGVWNIVIQGDQGPFVAFACSVVDEELVCEDEETVDTWIRAE